MLKKIYLGLTVVVLIALAAPGLILVAAQESEMAIPAPAQAGQANLLPNGSMDEGSFYWRPPNHYVPAMWYEWWDGSRGAPEFINGGHPHHNVCYPPPLPGKLCADTKNKSLGYIRYNAPTIAGGYQPVAVTPCQYYKFEIYNRNDEANYHPKIGIDPTGWQLPIRGADRPPDNCPPDGYSKCPDPSLDDISELPSTIVWSPEFDHTPYTWAGQSVVAEAVSTTITVWTYTAPEGASPSQSAYWDYGSLVQVPPPNGLLIASGELPPADGGIISPTSGTFLDKAAFRWQTAFPALAQVLYHYVGSASSANLPPIAANTDQYESRSDINANLNTAHVFQLQNLRLGAVYDVALLSRRWTGNQCQTSVYLTRIATSDLLAPIGKLQEGGEISSVNSTAVFNAATLNWQTPQPAYSQVLYHYAGPAESSTLPPIANDTRQYESKTDIAPENTAHSLKLPDLSPLSVYDVALLACQLVNDQCQLSVKLARITTTDLIVRPGALPTPGGHIVGPIIKPGPDNSAYVIWQSSQPAYSQVLYDYSPVVTHTAKQFVVYLPLVTSVRNSSGFTSDYRFHTLPASSRTTLHVVQLTGLQPNAIYRATALAAWGVDEPAKTAASYSTSFQTQAPVQILYAPADQLVEQLQTCLTAGNPLDVCADELAR